MILRLVLPPVALHTSPALLGTALVVSFAVGIAGGVLPARRAARLDSLEALRAE